MSEIKKDIAIFLNRVLSNQEEFLKKLVHLVSKFNEVKYLAVSRYQVTGEDVLFLKEKLEANLIIEIETLMEEFLLHQRRLHKEYKVMMENHLKESKKWKEKRSDPKYHVWYAHLTKQVLDEKINFRQKVEHNCSEINKLANEMLLRLKDITTINLEQRLGFKATKTLIEWHSTVTPDKWMMVIMSD